MESNDRSDHPRIAVDPEIMLGKPTIRGTRLTVELILEEIACGATVADLLEDYPRLTQSDVQAALQYAASRLHEEAERRRERVAF